MPCPLSPEEKLLLKMAPTGSSHSCLYTAGQWFEICAKTGYAYLKADWTTFTLHLFCVDFDVSE